MKRVRFDKSPLIEVIFQLRFPTILSIEQSIPSAFQQQIISKYPFFSQKNEEIKQILPDGTQKVISTNRNYEFLSIDKGTKINLTCSFLAISTRQYSVWENFSSVIDEIVTAFERVYNPPFYVRVGLRYINVITKSKWGLEQRKWNELLTPDVLGVLANNEKASNYQVEAEYLCKDGITLTHNRFGLVHVDQQAELSFMIDCDYFKNGITQTTEWKDISIILHDSSENFIRTIVSDVLFFAMEPQEIS